MLDETADMPSKQMPVMIHMGRKTVYSFHSFVLR